MFMELIKYALFRKFEKIQGKKRQIQINQVKENYVTAAELVSLAGK